jgi:hypothetical protein
MADAAHGVLPFWISGLEAATQGWGHNGGGNCKAAAKLGQAAQCGVGMPLVPVVFPMLMRLLINHLRSFLPLFRGSPGTVVEDRGRSQHNLNHVSRSNAPGQ